MQQDQPAQLQPSPPLPPTRVETQPCLWLALRSGLWLHLVQGLCTQKRFSVQPSPSLSSASTGLGPRGECAGAMMEPKNSERNCKNRKLSEFWRLLPPGIPSPASTSSPYLLGWGSPRHCTELRFSFIFLLRVAGGLETR